MSGEGDSVRENGIFQADKDRQGKWAAWNPLVGAVAFRRGILFLHNPAGMHLEPSPLTLSFLWPVPCGDFQVSLEGQSENVNP